MLDHINNKNPLIEPDHSLQCVIQAKTKRLPCHHGRRPAGQEIHVFSTDKARRELGYDPRPVEEALMDAVEWFQQNNFYR